MNGLALLGAASTCNAVSWNGKYWMASVEGATGGQTQVYSNDGITWLASGGGDTLFSGTSQALALATVKDGNEINTINLESRATTLESRATTLESEVDTLQLTQFGVGQSWSGNLFPSQRTYSSSAPYINNTNKPIYVNLYVQCYTSTTDFDNNIENSLYVYVDETAIYILRNLSDKYIQLGQNIIVNPGSKYRVQKNGTNAIIWAWYEFS